MLRWQCDRGVSIAVGQELVQNESTHRSARPAGDLLDVEIGVLDAVPMYHASRVALDVGSCPGQPWASVVVYNG